MVENRSTVVRDREKGWLQRNRNVGNILDLHTGGDYITVYISKLTELYTKKGEF